MFSLQMHALDKENESIYIKNSGRFACGLTVPSVISTPLIRINWDGEPSGHAENSDNWILL